MTLMVVVWGFNFIIVKDAVTDLAPLTFSALRFGVGIPLLLAFGLFDRGWMAVRPRDIAWIAILTATGPLLYQIGFTVGIQRTTATNAALIAATMPTWTAVFSILMRLVEVRRRLLVGIGMSLAGVTVVVLSRSDSGLALSHDDLIGSGLILVGSMASGLTNILSKPVVDEVGTTQTAIWKYIFTTVGMVILAAPDLLTLSAGDIPARTLPNILYSGMLSGVGGFLVVHWALHDIGPTRSSSYFNYNPIVAGLAGIAILGEPFSVWLLVGGALTLVGVAVVRGNTYLRKRPDAKAEIASPAPVPDTARR